MNSNHHDLWRKPWRASSRFAQAGYSIFDLIITSAVAGVLSLGAVGMNGLVQDARITSDVNELITHLNLVRSETIKRGQEVVLCPSADGLSCDEPKEDYTWWHGGYLLFVNMDGDTDRSNSEPIIRMRQTLSVASRLSPLRRGAALSINPPVSPPVPRLLSRFAIPGGKHKFDM